MRLRLVIQTILASTASLIVTSIAFAQPKLNSSPAAAAASIFPVSLANDSVAATVNGEKLYVGDVKKILDARPYPLTLKEDQKKQLRLAALDVLIEDAVMRHYFNKHVPQVSQADLNKDWQDLLAALQKKKESLKEFLARGGQNEETLRRDIIAKLQWKVLLQRRYPDDKLKQYYDANKPFFDKVEVRASHILIKLPPNPTKEQLDQAKQQILLLRQEILAGKTKFEEAAKKYSQCPTKDKGGDIGMFPYKFIVVPEFANAAFSMKKGEMSDVVQTIFGLHLILVTDRTAGEPSQFEPLKDTVREVWAQDEELYQRILAQQRKESDIKILLQ